MRRIVMFNNVTADGYFASADGRLDWVAQDEEVGKASADAGPGFDTVLFGRRTYEMFESFWPHALDDAPTAPDPHQPGHRSSAMRDHAVFLNEADKIVFSRTRKEVTWKNSRLVREFDPREIEAMKRQPGKDIIVFGSGTIVSELTRHSLVDEYQLVVGPVVLGAGKVLFSALPEPVKLETLEARTFRSGNVMLRYAPKTAAR
jgi:dihydrofolate reductase